MRRALIIFAIIIVVLGVAVGAFVYISGRTAKVVVAPNPSASLPTTGQNIPVDAGGFGQSTTTSSTGSPISVIGRLAKVSAGPVVPGEAVVTLPARDAVTPAGTAVIYIERQSGNVFSYLTNSGSINRTSNRTLPGIASATWLPDASAAFVRYLSDTNFSTLNTYALTSSGASGFFLPQNLSDIAVASTSILTLATGANGSVGSVARTDGSNASVVFTTPLTSVRASFAGTNKYLVFTKPSATLAGYAFVVDKSKQFSRVAGPLTGLVALASPTGKWLLVTHVRNGSMQMDLINTTTAETIPLPVATIADKCVWAADDSTVYCGIPVNPLTTYAYPDDWYQGAVQFSDRIWKIDTAGRYAELVLDFTKETSGSLDAVALALDAKRTTLAFVNKSDGSLWVYQL